jgi:hypothetical protein
MKFLSSSSLRTFLIKMRGNLNINQPNQVDCFEMLAMTKVNKLLLHRNLIILLFTIILLTSCTSNVKTSKARQCPDWSDNPKHNYSNKDFSNFGCAYNNNFNAQIADKNDLVKGKGKQIGEGDRETVNIGKYMSGTQATLPTLSTSGR